MKYQYITQKTVHPSGLAMSRSGANMICSWKLADKDYAAGLSFQYRFGAGAWQSVSVSTTATKATFAIPTSSYNPSTGARLPSVSFRVMGRRRDYEVVTPTKTTYYTMLPSEWAEYTFSLAAPDPVSSLTMTPDSEHENITTISWAWSDNATKWAINTYWESMLVKDCNVTDLSNLTWSSSATGWAVARGVLTSKTFTESTATLATGAWTRVFRILVSGPAGNSAYKYVKRIYAAPMQTVAKGSGAQAVPGGGVTVTASWEAPTSISRPIEKTVVQYAIATPLANLAFPSGASWTDGAVLASTSGTNKCSFTLANGPGADECLWTRVNTEYDGKVTYGAPTLAMVGALSAPTGLSVTTNPNTHRATITATNASSVPDSFLVVLYVTAANAGGQVIGIIPHGDTSTTVQCPDWGTDTVSFAVYAAQGSYTSTPRADGVGSYAVTARMRSATVTDGGAVPVAPASVSLAPTSTPGTIQVTWQWSWADATSAEISWADHADAWESTDEPETYTISNIHASRWNISGLDTGITWYVRVRLISGTGDNQTYGAYSDIKSIDLSSAPAIPVLSLSDGVITAHGSVTAAWSYSTTDGTLQAYAEVAEVVSGTYTVIATAETAQHITIDADDQGWETGETHWLAVRVVSGSGRFSDDWSDPVAVYVADPLTAVIGATSLEPQVITVDSVHKNINALTEMPLTVTVTGAGTGGTTTVIVERAETYHVSRPDESEYYGFRGETIAVITQQGESQITITKDDLLGNLDDGAAYRIIATVQDGLGQSAQDTKDFEVHWSHQAIIPSATVVIDSDAKVAKLTPIAPTGTATGDTCDIYRLSVDKPVLIYPGAAFGTTYVDPFPTLGEHGGHRFVFKTAAGDYITAESEMAWADTGEAEGDTLDSIANIIDFGAGRVELVYEIDLSNSWKKDFAETQYLGGSVQGDWNPAVSRSTSVSAVGVTADDQETIEAMRRLAEHPGICHIRTKDGSSFAADVQVKEDYKQANNQKLVYFSLSVTRVDPETYDGMTLAAWNQTHQEG